MKPPSPLATTLRRILAWLWPVKRRKQAASMHGLDAPRRPRKLVHPSLGTLVLAPGAAQYAVAIEWVAGGNTPSGSEGNKQLTLLIPAEEAHDLDATARTVQAMLADKENLDAALKRFMAAELLPSLNDGRAAAGRPPLTAHDLWGTVRLHSVTVYANGSYAFYYEDGDLLGGHTIEINGDLQQGPSFLDTPG